MPYAPAAEPRPRAERVRFEESTPVVLRLRDGRRSSGRLQVLSATGGLVSLERPLDTGAPVKLMFLTRKGSVLGEAQMLAPITWERQAFKFTALYDDDRQRLESVIESRLAECRRQNQLRTRQHEQVERFRAW